MAVLGGLIAILRSIIHYYSFYKQKEKIVNSHFILHMDDEIEPQVTINKQPGAKENETID